MLGTRSARASSRPRALPRWRQPAAACHGRSATPRAGRRRGTRWAGRPRGGPTQALGAPINISVRAGYPSVAELEALGVARVTTATQITLMALAAIRQVAREIKATGRFDAISPAIGHPEIQQLFPPKGR